MKLRMQGESDLSLIGQSFYCLQSVSDDAFIMIEVFAQMSNCLSVCQVSNVQEKSDDRLPVFNHNLFCSQLPGRVQQ